MIKKVINWLLIIFGSIIGLVLVSVLIVRLSVHIPQPDISNNPYISFEIDTLGENFYTLGQNWLKKNEHGLWEMYIEGDGATRGIVAGKLCRQLIHYQEEVFVNEIKNYIKSDTYLGFLRLMVGYFNRNLHQHIPQEYIDEIYGISLSASKEFDKYGEPFLRILNYHAAHDIGHALQNYALVGCTSFALWDQNTVDGTLYAGRNFDFYFGDAFAEEKIVEFVRPDDGIPFVFITWGAMIGTVSGMNSEGLSVTINAAKSDIPTEAAAPVSLVAREILQYASTIEEAFKIAKSRQMFVAESFMVSSANENRAILIEKTPTLIDTFTVSNAKLLCSNHFQSEIFQTDSVNLQNIRENATGYRFKRMEQLLSGNLEFNEDSVAKVLRDIKGMNNKKIGIGNEKAVNQMISHHSVIFNPSSKVIWVSTPKDIFHPYIAYDLDIVFDSLFKFPASVVSDSDKLIPADDFIYSEEYKNYYNYKRLFQYISERTDDETIIENDSLSAFIDSNPNYYLTYEMVGDYYYSLNEYDLASHFYTQALEKEINAVPVRNSISEKNKASRHKSIK